MSYIIGGGGGGGGLTEAEVTTLIGGIEPKLLDASDRNGATSTGVAAIYNPCKTIFNEHRPVCTKEYHLTGKYLDGADNPDVWFPIKGVGVNAEVTYSNRVLTLKSGTGTDSASRCVIDQTKFPITSNFLEVTCEISAAIHGEGGEKRTAIGFMGAFSAYDGSSFVGFSMNKNGVWIVASAGQAALLTSRPLGRALQNGDLITIRLDRQEGSSNIDIARFYVNGQKQWENVTIPVVDLYAGVGVFSSSLTDVSRSLSIKYFGVRYVP